MGPEDPHSGPAGDGADERAELSWQERELIGALRRLALAQSQLQTLEEAAAEAVPAPEFDHEALAELEAIHEELVAAREKGRSRFGGGHARERAGQLEARQAELLQHLGASSLVEAQAMAAVPPPAEVVDPAVLDFARREVLAATKAWDEVRALELPPADDAPPTADDDGPGADVVDLRSRQQAS
ncbi:MAG: hypothetical protein U0Q07_03500 [Acidimicrobiales bacterium]